MPWPMVNYPAVSDVADGAVIKSKQRSQYDIFVPTPRPLDLHMMTATNRRCAGQTVKIGIISIDTYLHLARLHRFQVMADFW